MEWTLEKLIFKIQNDLELHAENFVTPEEVKAFINDAIADAEQLIIDSFSDFFLTFVDYPLAVSDAVIPLPDDIFDFRIRGIYYDTQGYAQSDGNTSDWYKIKKLPLERFALVNKSDIYHYRLINDNVTGPRIGLYPSYREKAGALTRLWYIRQASRLINNSDVLETGIKPQFILSHAKIAVMNKEGDPMIDVQMANLAVQEQKMVSAISRLTDDDEDSYLEMTLESLDEAYGDQDTWTNT